MDRFDSLTLFARIVELGSFSRAAESLGIPRATATHAIKQLESRLGSRLLDRTTRRVRPTLDGDAFYQRISSVLVDLDEAEDSLQQNSGQPKGKLRVGLHGTHATRIILPNIAQFHRRYPGIELEISSGDRLVDLVHEGIDCVVRAGHPENSSLVAKRLAMMNEVICASPSYLDTYGKPMKPEDLPQHHAVGFFTSGQNKKYPFELDVEGELVEFLLPSWLAVNDAESYVAAALEGCGLIQLPRFHVEEYLNDGRLVEVLADWPSPALPVSAIYPYHRQLSRRVRVFIDWLSELYQKQFGPG
jgi:LysR family transcriptional regulator for bpeEF and oprC